jgi:hypothetical protein
MEYGARVNWGELPKVTHHGKGENATVSRQNSTYNHDFSIDPP